MNIFPGNIYKWYTINKRNLPWRKDKDPYKIWLSEIILQQTRVEQGKSYFIRFIERFPTVNNLAAASEDDVLKLWQGLGYYSRARNLHTTAKIISNEHQGIFPENYKDILSLKGVGPYTAAAISSIAFNLPFATVDGNIYRVLSRYYGITAPIDSTRGKKQFQELAEELMEDQDPGMHNQALMEFGALQCIPKSPECRKCPVFDSCYAFKNNQVNILPAKEKKTKQRQRFFYFYVYDMGDTLILEKRTLNGIWKNLYQFPLIEKSTEVSEVNLLEMNLPIDCSSYNIKYISPPKKHILSHQIIIARLIYLEVEANVNITEPRLQVNKKDIPKFAVPRLIEQFMDDINREP